MRDIVDEPVETGPDTVIGPPPEETPKQLAYRMSAAWVDRCCRDTVKLHLELDRIKLLWLRMNGNLPHLRALLARLREWNAAEGVELTPRIPEELVQERLLANLVYDLELMDIFPSEPVREVFKLRDQAPVDPTPVRARVTVWESGAWEVHAARSELEPAGAAVDFVLSSELLRPSRVEIPAYAIMKPEDK